MEYINDNFSFPPHHPPQQMFYQPMPYPVYVQGHPPPMESFYQQYPHADYADFMQAGLMHDEFEDMTEVSTRPRLTKEQVEVLEAQFQAHPKPNSVVKRQLAMQTKLTLPRVANWFQNRRAKAKQQKKQEEFEITQSMGPVSAWSTEADSAEQTSSQSDRSTSLTSGTTQSVSPTRQTRSDAASSCSGNAATDSKEASWASLQRALAAAKAGQISHPHLSRQQNQAALPMAPPELPQQAMTMQLPMRAIPVAIPGVMADMPDWSIKTTTIDAWPSPHALQDTPFDFGFEQDSCGISNQDSATDGSPPDPPPQSYSLSPDNWQEALPTPKGLSQQKVQSPEFQMPAYPASRRGSAADDLTANFGSFALVSSSPHPVSTSLPQDQLRQIDGQIDLAARRKRPRPAALTSASLRSRSYGAMTSASPTFRNGMTPPAHVVRHVKSQGHSLNARYSGIRKASSAQRSPMNFSTFAEADAFHRLMAQQPSFAPSSVDGPLLSPAILVNSQVSPTEESQMMASKLEATASQYQLPASQHLTLGATSPPTTPFRPDYVHQGRPSQAMPPVSAPPQYASFPDYTPPYSAGPLTNSSWSDAPLTSPELPNFPPVTYIPSVNYSQQSENLQAQFQHFVLPSDLKTEMSPNADQRKTEFFIQEFPNQKEQHAQVAKQLAQQKPKSYSFANTAPSDYDQI